jgi:hypothetical protein
MRPPGAPLHSAILAGAPVFIGGIDGIHVACSEEQLPACKINFTFIIVLDIMTLLIK